MSRKNSQAVVTKERQRRSWLPIAAILVLIALLGAVYVGLAQYYTDRFPMRTQINGIDVSNLTAASVKRKLNAEAQKYTLTIQERSGGSETISSGDIDLNYNDNGDVDTLLAGYNRWEWPINLFFVDELVAAEGTVYDEELVQEVIAELDCFDPKTVISPSDACLVLTDDGITIQKEVEGTELDVEKATERLLKAIKSGETQVDLEAEGLYLAPEIRSDSETLIAEQEKLAKWLSAEITFDFEDDRIMTVDRDVIYSWLTEDDQGVYSIDLEKATEWVKTELAYKTDTFGLTHEFKTHDGETISLTGGDYGWCIAREDTAKKIIESVKEGKVETMEPEYLYKANFRGVNDIGDKYIEVDLGEQKVFAYKDGELLVESDVVTGCVSKGTETPSGSVWAVDCHKSPATLGTMDTMGYSSPVTYWMSFTGNVGLHDADGWRSAYGGNIYKTNGSHGCVNTPYSAMQTIFQNFNVGDPVIVHK